MKKITEIILILIMITTSALAEKRNSLNNCPASPEEISWTKAQIAAPQSAEEIQFKAELKSLANQEKFLFNIFLSLVISSSLCLVFLAIRNYPVFKKTETLLINKKAWFPDQD